MTKPERRAFYETLIADYSESVFRFLYRSLGNWHDAEDLTNEVFENAWRGLDQLQKPESAKAWLFAICRNRMRTKLQRRKKAAPLETINESDLPVDRGDEVEHRDTIQFAASHLDSQTLEVVLLVEMERFSVTEVAQLLNQPRGTVLSRLHRGKQRMRDVLERQNTSSVSKTDEAQPKS